MSEILADDPLVDVQLQVARRADELAARPGMGTSLNLHCWLLAEREILGASVADSFSFSQRPEAEPAAV
jgi:hypothetical protein